jgi:hypothetical protein
MNGAKYTNIFRPQEAASDMQGSGGAHQPLQQKRSGGTFIPVFLWNQFL